jgi:hypothetical protein
MVDITWNDDLSDFQANVTCEVFESIFELRLNEFTRPISLTDIQARERGRMLTTRPIKAGVFRISDGNTLQNYNRVSACVASIMGKVYRLYAAETIKKDDTNSNVSYISSWTLKSSLVAADAGRGFFFWINVQFTEYETDTESNCMSVTMNWVYMNTSGTFRQLVFPQLIEAMSQKHHGYQTIQYISDIYNEEKMLLFFGGLILDLRQLGITEFVDRIHDLELQWIHMGRRWQLNARTRDTIQRKSSSFNPPGSQLRLIVGQLPTATERITDQIIYSLNMGQA